VIEVHKFKEFLEWSCLLFLDSASAEVLSCWR
jgi:hypothetical protein